jgi:hypothetical protein
MRQRPQSIVAYGKFRLKIGAGAQLVFAHAPAWDILARRFRASLASSPPSTKRHFLRDI